MSRTVREIDRNDRRGIFHVECQCRTITWNCEERGSNLVVRCGRCGVRNRIPARIGYTPPPPTTEGVSASTFSIPEEEY